MALVTNIIGTMTAIDGSVCTVSQVSDDVTGVVDHITVDNPTPLPASFWCLWKGTTFSKAIPAGQAQDWVPTSKQIKWLTDPIQFGWGIG